MARPDRTVRKVAHRVGAESAPKEPSAAEKLTRYFPEAALALYLGLDPLLRQVAEGDALRGLLWGALLLTAVFAWFYLVRFWITTPRQRWISVGALILYVAAIGGPFATIDGYETIYGTIAAVVATAFMILLPAEDVPSPPP